MINIPADREIFDRSSATFWFDNDGILNAVSKNVPRNLETVKSNGDFLNSLLKGQKVCCLYDTTLAGPMSTESRAFVKKQLPDLYKAVAIITKSAVGKMFGTVIYALMPPYIPVKMFNDEAEARNWLKQYL
jgi:hypothetical protein